MRSGNGTVDGAIATGNDCLADVIAQCFSVKVTCVAQYGYASRIWCVAHSVFLGRTDTRDSTFVLDLSPIIAGCDAADAFRRTLHLVQHAERLG